MKVKCDDKQLKLTAEFIETTKAFMRATMRMMHQTQPQFISEWQIGACKITDFAVANGMSFFYGRKEDTFLFADADITVEL